MKRTLFSLLIVLQIVSSEHAVAATFTTWTQRATAQAWTSVSCSTNCEIVYASVSLGSIYKSTDGGSNWTELTNSGSRSWKALATSDDGQVIYGAVSNGFIYVSRDSGQTWTVANGAQSRAWISLSTDSTGAVVAAGVSAGSVWLTTDSGSNWSEITSIGTSKTWKALALTPAGTVLVAGNSSGEIWRGVSTSGTWAWTHITSGKTATPLYGGSPITLTSLGWNSIAINNTGEKIAAISNDLYFSGDSGSTWRNITWGNYLWVSVSGSSDLKTMMMLASNACGSNCRPHIVTTTDYSTFSESIVGSVGIAYSSGAFADDGSRAIAATSSSYIYTAGDSYVPISTPTATLAPAITGSATFGQTLSTNTGTWSNSPTSYSYQWSRSATSNGTYSNIAGATNSSYSLVTADVEQFIKVTVTATNSSGSASSTSSATTQISKANQNLLSISTLNGNFGTPLTLNAIGGSGTGNITYSYTQGTATCTLSGNVLSASSAGTCLITGTKAADSNYNATSTSQTTITFAAATTTSSISVSTNSLTFRRAVNLTTTTTTTGKVTFKANNVNISGCRNLITNALNSYTRTCSYKPSTRGMIVISVVFTPLDSSYLPSTAKSPEMYVVTRTDRR